MNRLNIVLQKNSRSYILVGLLALSHVLGYAAPAEASQGEAQCARWYKKTYFAMAAKCFLQLTNSIKSTKQEASRIQYGIWVRNASFAYQKAADKEKKAQRQSYLREKGLRLLQRYIKEKLYGTETQRRTAKSLIENLEEKIGYVNLTVLPNDPKAKVQVIGFKFRKKLSGGGVLQVRPGRYTVFVVYPDQRRDAKTISLQPSEPHVLRFGAAPPKRVAVRPPTPPVRIKPKVRPAPPKAGVPWGGWVLLGGGVLAVATGSVLSFVIATNTNSKAASTLNTAKQNNNVELTREAGALNDSANMTYAIGWVVSGVGVVAAGIGVGLVVAGGPPAAKPTASLNPTTPTRQQATLLLQTP